MDRLKITNGNVATKYLPNLSKGLLNGLKSADASLQIGMHRKRPT